MTIRSVLSRVDARKVFGALDNVSDISAAKLTSDTLDNARLSGIPRTALSIGTGVMTINPGGSTPTHHSVWSGFARANDGKAKSLGTVGLYPRSPTTFTDAMGTPRHECWGNGWQRKQRLDTPTEA